MNDHESRVGTNDATVLPATNKRDFLKLMGGASIGLGLGLPAAADAAQATCLAAGSGGANVRRNTAYQARLSAAQAQRDQFECSNTPNGDENILPANIGSYSKGLAHNELGEVSPTAYSTLVFALNNNSRSALATVAMGTTPPHAPGRALPGIQLLNRGSGPPGRALPAATDLQQR